MIGKRLVKPVIRTFKCPECSFQRCVITDYTYREETKICSECNSEMVEVDE